MDFIKIRKNNDDYKKLNYFILNKNNKRLIELIVN